MAKYFQRGLEEILGVTLFAGMEPAGSPVTDGDFSSPDAPRGTRDV